MTDTTITAEMTLREAGPLWLESRRPFLSPVTCGRYPFYLETLYQFLGNKALEQITGDDIRSFQRVQVDAKRAAETINHCGSILQQILKRVNLWGAIADQYEAVPLPKESRGRALSDEEEYRLFKVASLNPNWEVCYNAALLSAHTAAGPGEIRKLRLRDVHLGNGDMSQAWVKIREGAKNQYRVRTIPLDREAYGALEALYRLAHEHGSTLPEHYLMPYRVHKGLYDPTRCQTTFKTAWREMCTAAGLEGFRLYDLRHHALTRLAEKAPEQVVLKIAGHVSPQMLRKVYSHVRDAAVREAIDSLSRPDGWKPREEAVRKLMPKHSDRSKVVGIVRKAEQIKAETAPEDTSWIDLAGGE